MKTQWHTIAIFFLSSFFSFALSSPLPLGSNYVGYKEYRNDNFTCSSPEGLYANPDDCSSFYQCSNGDPYLQTCPSGLFFNGDIQQCDYPSNVNCADTSSTTSTAQTVHTTAQAYSTTETYATTEAPLISSERSTEFSSTSATNSITSIGYTASPSDSSDPTTIEYTVGPTGSLDPTTIEYTNGPTGSLDPTTNEYTNGPTGSLDPTTDTQFSSVIH